MPRLLHDLVGRGFSAKSEVRNEKTGICGARGCRGGVAVLAGGLQDHQPDAVADYGPGGTASRIDTESDAALARLYKEVSGSRELIQSAQGVLVLPNVVSGGLIFGGAGGNGVLRVADKSASYWRMSEAQIGLLGGAQSQSVFIVFLTPGRWKALPKAAAGARAPTPPSRCPMSAETAPSRRRRRSSRLPPTC